MPAQSFEVPPAAAGTRLDRFLVSSLGRPRHQVQRLIRCGAVAVNGVPPSVHRWLRAGDRVVVQPSTPPPAPVAPLPLQVVGETSDYLVVWKPAGVVTHPAPGTVAPALTAAITAARPAVAAVGDPDRPGIVHRLDRDVPGLLVVAKTAAMYDELQRQFRERRVRKGYTALVEGVVAKPDGVLDFVMARSRTRPGRMAARPKGQAGRAAETRYTVVRRFAHHTLLELELVTGRTHQIRAHCRAFGHPIVGDPVYGSKRGTVGLTRPFLQATTLGFHDAAGTWQEFTAPLDAALRDFLATIS